MVLSREALSPAPQHANGGSVLLCKIDGRLPKKLYDMSGCRVE